MTVAPAVAPYVPTYATRVPYLLASEYLGAPTGVDTSQLIPGGSPSENRAALDRTIRRASAWVNSICKQVLAATTDVQANRYRVRADRTVQVPCARTPIIAVTAVEWGRTPSGFTALTDLSDVWPGRKVVTVPLRPGRPGEHVYVKVTYLNGFPNTALTAAAESGATSVTVDDATGIMPGLPMRADDGSGPVDVTVDSTYTIGDTTVPLAAGLPSAVASGALFTAMPDDVKEATIALTTVLIKTRGEDALVMDAMTGEPTREQVKKAGAVDDFDLACRLLNNHIRTW